MLNDCFIVAQVAEKESRLRRTSKKERRRSAFPLTRQWPIHPLGRGVLLCVSMGMVGLFMGCGNAAETAATITTGTPSLPAGAVPAEIQAILADIENAPDFVKLNEIQEKHKAGTHHSEVVKQALARKWMGLTTDMSPRTMVEGIDFLAVDAKVTGKEEYTFSFLLKSTAHLDTDYHLGIVARVDEGHIQYIKPNKAGEARVNWGISLYNDLTSKWNPGEYHVAQLKVKTTIIPYNLAVFMQTRNAQRRWSGNLGNKIELGWLADVAK